MRVISRIALAFIGFVLTVAVASHASAQQQQAWRLILHAKLRKFEMWAGHCPENYHNRYALVCAELARIEGSDLDAMRFYEQAVQSAKDVLAAVPGLPVVDKIAKKLNAESEGERAAALEMALEALYLAKRIDKVSGEGQTVYG